MSSMKGITSASMPRAWYSACTDSQFFSPVWCVTRGRSPLGISLSASGNVSLSTLAPRLPPTSSTRSGPARLAKRSAGAAMASISARTGLPVTSALGVARASSPSKPNAMRSHDDSSDLLDISSAASALTSTSGFLNLRATLPPGTQT